MLRPLGSSLPLGFFAFSTGMSILGGLDTGLIAERQLHQTGALLLTFVAPLEALAAVLAFLARDGLAGTGLGLFAGSWTAIGVQEVIGRPGATSPVLGLYLFTFTVVIVLLGIVAVRGQPLLAVLLLTAAVRTVLAGVYEVSGNRPLFRAAGGMGFVIAVIGFYGAVAFLLEDSAGTTILPLARRGAAKASISGDLATQVESLDTEAGVRQTL